MTHRSQGHVYEEAAKGKEKHTQINKHLPNIQNP